MTASSSRTGQALSATRIGAFVVIGLLLIVAGVIAAGGGAFLRDRQRVEMHFSGSTFGLQVGAPVVFRGVKLGTVSAIGLRYDAGTERFSIPVQAELEPQLIRGLEASLDKQGRSLVSELVARGLSAQLSMQSLLTGQLYVDLDLRPGQQVERAPQGAVEARWVEIPTRRTGIQNLKRNLDDLDFKRLVDDLSAIADSARSVVAGPELKQALKDVVEITRNLQNVSQQLDQQIGPLSQSAQSTLATARSTLREVGQVVTVQGEKVGRSADRLAGTADRLGRTADRVGELLAPDAPLVQRVQQAADALAGTAGALQRQLGESGELPLAARQALGDVSRAARSLRELADALQAQPSSVIRGAAPPAPWPSSTAPSIPAPDASGPSSGSSSGAPAR